MTEDKSMDAHIVNPIRFEKAEIKHQDIIFTWLMTPHMQAFWDNSQEHKDDILNFIYKRKQHYFYGTTKYWVGYYNDQPYCFILTDVLLPQQKGLSDLHQRFLSKHGKTIGLDFGIGNVDYLGKGLAAKTLRQFMNFYHQTVDHEADTFFIDPNYDNPRAIHVYQKAGFKFVGAFSSDQGFFKGHQSYLMVKKILHAQLEPASLADYPIVQNLARFYIYDLSRYCGVLPGWECPENGLFKSFDFEKYFTEANHFPFLIKVHNELAGFALIDQSGVNLDTNWNMAEFFILAKFQEQGIGRKIAYQIWDQFRGKWEVSVMPVNKAAMDFWRKIIVSYTQNQFSEGLKTLQLNSTLQRTRYIYSFNNAD